MWALILSRPRARGKQAQCVSPARDSAVHHSISAEHGEIVHTICGRLVQRYCSLGGSRPRVGGSAQEGRSCHLLDRCRQQWGARRATVHDAWRKAPRCVSRWPLVFNGKPGPLAGRHEARKGACSAAWCTNLTRTRRVAMACVVGYNGRATNRRSGAVTLSGRRPCILCVCPGADP
jgi:hypothetical protein